eukprot:985715_1
MCCNVHVSCRVQGYVEFIPCHRSRTYVRQRKRTYGVVEKVMNDQQALQIMDFHNLDAINTRFNYENADVATFKSATEAAVKIWGSFASMIWNTNSMGTDLNLM